MINKLKVLAIVPARGGSKRIPNKNIKPLCGKPLLVYAIEQGKASKYIDRVIVSTDSEEIKAIALKYGAEVPFLRPTEISGDSSTDLELFT
ncbi:MAG: acylneuraminate cytidylyltransferase family protein, partial [Candidatus Pacebacteria bacterium]|nr:acylneuraminate cytidylyltransferase family protein [Candidatus Paceibacterota bacterium]